MELDGFKDLEQQRQAREDFFEKAFDPTYIEKGKRGGTGEIREWKDGKYQKQSDGTWKPVKDGGVKKEDSSSIVGKKFNHEGLTYQVTKQGATQSEAVAITESKKGKKIVIDNKVIEKQASSSKGESKQPTTLSEFREYLKKQGEAKGDKELVQYAKTATTETLKKRWGSFRSGEEPKKSEEKYSEMKLKLFNGVRAWTGDEFTNEIINSVYEPIYGRKGRDIFRVPRTKDQDKFFDDVHTQTLDITKRYMSLTDRDKSLTRENVMDIARGLVMASSQ